MRHLTLSENLDLKCEGKKANEQDYDILINEDAEVRKPNGDLLCVVLKNSIPRPVLAEAWSVLKDMNMQTNNRGLATGEGRMLRKRKDGSDGKTNIAGESVNSGIIGFFERTPRFPYCRACAWNLQNPEKWAKLVPMVQNVDWSFKKFAPDRYDKQAAIARYSNPDFLIPGTHFSTLTVNKNFRTAYHRDAGNLPQGISCMSVIRQGKWSGANLVFPDFRVAAKLDTADMIIFDPHEIHGNTPITYLTPDAVRCSVVYYFRDKIQHCGSAEDELAIVKNRKQGEQMFAVKVRKGGIK